MCDTPLASSLRKGLFCSRLFHVKHFVERPAYGRPLCGALVYREALRLVLGILFKPLATQGAFVPRRLNVRGLILRGEFLGLGASWKRKNNRACGRRQSKTPTFSGLFGLGRLHCAPLTPYDTF